MAGLSLHAAICTYLDVLDADGIPWGTVKQYRSTLYRLHRMYPGRQYRAITIQDLDRFLRTVTKGRASSTASGHRSALRSFFEYGELMQWGKHVTIPKPPVRKRGVTVAYRPPTRLPAPVLYQLLEGCPDDQRGRVLRGMVAVAMNTAWRISDIVKIRVGEVDLLTGDLFFKSKKTGKVDAFPVTIDLDEEIRRYLAWYTETTGLTLADRDAYLFACWKPHGTIGEYDGFTYTPDPTKPISTRWAGAQIKKLYEACGVHAEKREAWHVIRRSVARIYFDSLRENIGFDHALRQTAALLQHENTYTTEKYLGLNAEIVARDESMRGKSIIPRPTSNVVPLTSSRSRHA